MAATKETVGPELSSAIFKVFDALKEFFGQEDGETIAYQLTWGNPQAMLTMARRLEHADEHSCSVC